MHIVDAIKALKGGLATEKEAHMTTMTERDTARDHLKPWIRRAEQAEAALAPLTRYCEDHSGHGKHLWNVPGRIGEFWCPGFAYDRT